MVVKKILCFLGCAVALFAGNASAAILTYQYVAKINSLFEFDQATGNFTYPESSTMAGGTVSMNDTITGFFSFDTNTPLSPWGQPDPIESGSYLSYEGGIRSSMTFGGSGLHYQSDPDSLSLAYVADNASIFGGSDVFTLSTTAQNLAGDFTMMYVSMFNNLGEAFDGGGIPQELSLSMFDFTTISYSLIRAGDGNQMNASGSLVSLTLIDQADVPEPGTLLLGLLGFAGMATFTRRRPIWPGRTAAPRRLPG